jgi:chromosome segregation ATPase
MKMMTVRVATRSFALVLFAVLLAACGGQQEPAQKTIESSEASLNAMREDGTKYAPDEFKDVEATLQNMKANYARKDYSAVLTAGRELRTSIQGLADTIKSRKEEMSALTEQLTEQWNSLSSELPDMVESVTARVESINKSGKLPKDVDQATFDRIKGEAETMSQRWQQALAAFANGNMQEAVDMAQVAKDKASMVMTTLGMT